MTEVKFYEWGYPEFDLTLENDQSTFLLFLWFLFVNINFITLTTEHSLNVYTSCSATSLFFLYSIHISLQSLNPVITFCGWKSCPVSSKTLEIKIKMSCWKVEIYASTGCRQVFIFQPQTSLNALMKFVLIKELCIFQNTPEEKLFCYSK